MGLVDPVLMVVALLQIVPEVSDEYRQNGVLKVFAGLVPQGYDPPYCRVASVFGRHEEHMTGPSGLAQSRVQVDFWDTDVERLNKVSQGARYRMAGSRGSFAIGDLTAELRRVHIEESAMDAEHASDGTGSIVYRMRHDYRVDYLEAVW